MSNPYTSTHIIQITDTTDRNAMLKIRGAYLKHTGAYGLRDAGIDVVPSRNTLDIGVAASEQIHNTERADRLLLALNCAPAEKEEGTESNHRQDFYYADLGDGILTGGTIAGLELAYVKGQIKALFRDVSTNSLDSQFRSLQVLPKRLVQFATPQERKKLVADGIFREVSDIDALVQDVPDATHVIEVDEPFQNVKLWLSRADRAALPRAQKAQFDFGPESVEYAPRTAPQAALEFSALVRDTLFRVPLDHNGIALSSSSRVLGGQPVPMIATVRRRPAETAPNYRIPRVGHPAFLRCDTIAA